MSDEIQIGDLVRVAYPSPCCKRSDNVGIIFVVKDIQLLDGRCKYCNSAAVEKMYIKTENFFCWSGYIRSELEKINPDMSGDSAHSFTVDDIEVTA